VQASLAAMWGNWPRVKRDTWERVATVYRRVLERQGLLT
jgi:hypothetical protein